MPLAPSIANQAMGVVHASDNPVIIDYPSYISVREWGGCQSTAQGVSPILSFPPLGTGVAQAYGATTTDDALAINAALLAVGLGGSGMSLYFPAGTYLVTGAAIVNTYNVPIILAPGANITGTYAGTITLAAAGSALSAQNRPGFARAVMTTVVTSTTYVGTTTNTLTFGTNAIGFGTQDGITTLKVGDCVILQSGTLGSCAITACDTGPWIISVVGTASTKAVLVRPSWYQTGMVIPIGYQIQVGPEGTQFANTKWTSWANTPNAATIAVGTTATDPLFYPDHTQTLITLSSGFLTTTTIPIRSTTLTAFAYQSASYSGGTTTAKFATGAISSGGAATAAGGVGTGSVSITALAVGGTVVAGDGSTGWLHIWNRQ